MTEFRVSAGEDDRRKSRKRGKSSRSTSMRRSASRRKNSRSNSESRGIRRQARVLRKRAQGRQLILDWLHMLLLGMQLLALIGIVCASVIIYNVLPHERQAFYYLIQVVIEIIMFIVASITICHANSFFRVCLLSGHLCAATFAFFLVKTIVVDRNIHLDCWNNGENCVWIWPPTSYFHLVYLGFSAGIVHMLLGLISLMVIFFFEGSIDYYMMTAKGDRLLDGKILMDEAVHRDSHQRSRKRSRSSQKRGLNVAVPLGSLVKQQKMTKVAHGVVLDGEGKPRGYGTAVTKTKTTTCETPTFVARRTSSKTELKTVELKKKPSKGESKPKEAKNSSKSSQTESTKADQRPGKFNSISKMPALESPIAYLNRREKENNKKSSYAF